MLGLILETTAIAFWLFQSRDDAPCEERLADPRVNEGVITAGWFCTYCSNRGHSSAQSTEAYLLTPPLPCLWISSKCKVIITSKEHQHILNFIRHFTPRFRERRKKEIQKKLELCQRQVELQKTQRQRVKSHEEQKNLYQHLFGLPPDP